MEISSKPKMTTLEKETDKVDQVYQDVLGSGDLMAKVIKCGKSEKRPAKGEQIVINLVGRLRDSNDIIEEAKNLEITLGDFEVIHGVQVAVSLMNQGDIVELQIASTCGYGKKGLEPKVPGEAKLVYIVELVAIKPEIVPDKLTPVERLKIGLQKKEKGNWWFIRNENCTALYLYHRALQYFGNTGETIGSDLESENISKERIKTLNNMALTHTSLNNLSIALEFLDYVLEIEPNNVKGIIRKSRVLFLKGQNIDAARELKKALEIDPHNKQAQKLLNNVTVETVKEKTQEKEYYKKMFEKKNKNTDGKPIKDTNKSNSRLIISGLVAGLIVMNNSQIDWDIKEEHNKYDDIGELENLPTNLSQLTDETLDDLEVDANNTQQRLPLQSYRRGHSPEDKEVRNKSKKAYEDDEFDLFGKILAKKLRKLPEKEAEKFMYKIDEMFIERYRRNNEHA